MLSSSGRLLILTPRVTIFCLEHFIQASVQIHNSLIKYRSRALIKANVSSHPVLKPSRITFGRVTKSAPPTVRRRVQPRRAVRGRAPIPETDQLASPTTVENHIDTESQSREEKGWKVRGLRKNGVTTTASRELPEELLPALRSTLEYLRGRNKARKGVESCSCGPEAWTCVFCDAQQQAWRELQEMDVCLTGSCSEQAPIADMGASEISKRPVKVLQPTARKEGKIDERRVVVIGPLRFVVDVCDGESKMMFLSMDEPERPGGLGTNDRNT